MAGVAFGGKAITVQYPEEQHVPSPNYRGVHRLNKDEQGRVKCVACMLCATACPAHCIDIVGATAPDDWPDREKYPESFVIDELRCIYCGMCEEACPVEAIELTGLYDLTGLSREQMIFDKAKLLSVFDVTKDAEPMRFGAPPTDPGPAGPAPTATPIDPLALTTNAPDKDGIPRGSGLVPRYRPGRRRHRPGGDRHVPAAAAPARLGEAEAGPRRRRGPGGPGPGALRPLLERRPVPSCRASSSTPSAWPPWRGGS